MRVCACVRVLGESAAKWLKHSTANQKGGRLCPSSHYTPLGTLPQVQMATWPIRLLGMDKTTGCAYSTNVHVHVRCKCIGGTSRAKV